MATRKPPPGQASLTVDQMRKGITRLERLIKEVEALMRPTLQSAGGQNKQLLKQPLKVL